MKVKFEGRDDEVDLDVWASQTEGNAETWLDYVYDGKRYHVNASWLWSGHQCIFGQGCPSVMLTGITEHGGCCQIGTHIADKKELKRVRKSVEQLTQADTMYELSTITDWYYETDDELGEFHTAITNTGCVFSNVPGNRFNAPVGCALHAMALRTGQSHIDTKPGICWQLPNGVTETLSDDPGGNGDGMTRVDVTYTSGGVWAARSGPNHRKAPGWMCTETPDAFNSGKPVYETYKDELVAMLGEGAYNEMVRWLLKTRVKPVAGASFADGRPLIPLYVEKRMDMWGKDALNDKKPNRQHAAKELIGRSSVYMYAHKDVRTPDIEGIDPGETD